MKWPNAIFLALAVVVGAAIGFTIAPRAKRMGVAEIHGAQEEPIRSDGVRARLPPEDAGRRFNWVEYRLDDDQVLVVWLYDDGRQEARVYVLRQTDQGEWKMVSSESIPYHVGRLSHVMIGGVDHAGLIDDKGLLIHSVLFKHEP